MLTVFFKKLRDVKTPSRSYSQPAGWDFFVPEDMEWESKTLWPGESILIPSGIQMKIPHGYAMRFDNKSGMVGLVS